MVRTGAAPVEPRVGANAAERTSPAPFVKPIGDARPARGRQRGGELSYAAARPAGGRDRRGPSVRRCRARRQGRDLPAEGIEACAAFFGTLAHGAVVVVVNEIAPASPDRAHLAPLGCQCGADRTWRNEATRTTGRDRRRRLLDVTQLEPRAGARSAPPHRHRTWRRSSTRPARPVCPRASRCRTRTCGRACKPSRSYLEITRDDRIASLLPFSFDYGLNQLLCAVGSGATLVDRAVAGSAADREDAARAGSDGPARGGAALVAATAHGGVPSRSEPIASLRCMTNTGGRLPAEAVRQLRRSQPQARAVPDVRPDRGVPERVPRPGEGRRQARAHRQRDPGRRAARRCARTAPSASPARSASSSTAVRPCALGYWDDPGADRTGVPAEPVCSRGTPSAERVVFSGDHVRRDDGGRSLLRRAARQR